MGKAHGIDNGREDYVGIKGEADEINSMHRDHTLSFLHRFLQTSLATYSSRTLTRTRLFTIYFVILWRNHL